MDLNADGHPDILSGSYSRQDNDMAGLFQVLWGQTGGTFKKAAVLNGTDNQPLIIPKKSSENPLDAICTRPFATDWDGDGDLDLVVGNFAGTFYLFTGEGGGKFAPKPQLIPIGESKSDIAAPATQATNGQPAIEMHADATGVGHHSDPFVIDWDGDGDLDIISGSARGGVYFAENTAGPKKPPVLKRFVPLIAPEDSPKMYECRPDEIVHPAASTRVWVADVNGDGKLDLLVGDSINVVTPATGLSEAEFTKRYDEWNAQNEAIGKEMQAANPQSEQDHEKLQPLYEKMNAHYQKRGEFMSEDRTGFVWVYLRK